MSVYVYVPPAQPGSFTLAAALKAKYPQGLMSLCCPKQAACDSQMSANPELSNYSYEH